MKKIARQGSALLAAIGTVVASVLLVAPTAWAAPPSMDVYLSSNQAGPVSGSALVLLVSPSDSGSDGIYVNIYFPASSYELETFNTSGCSGAITQYGLSMTVDGSPATIAECYVTANPSSVNPLQYELWVEASTQGTSACLVWNSSLTRTRLNDALGPVEPFVGGVTLPDVTPTVSSSACSESAPTATSSDAETPVAPLQQFSVPAGTTREECAALAPSTVDWPGLELHRKLGWSVSYAQWPNGGAGGWVCSRQPYRNGSGWSS